MERLGIMSLRILNSHEERKKRKVKSNKLCGQMIARSSKQNARPAKRQKEETYELFTII